MRARFLPENLNVFAIPRRLDAFFSTSLFVYLCLFVLNGGLDFASYRRKPFLSSVR